MFRDIIEQQNNHDNIAIVVDSHLDARKKVIDNMKRNQGTEVLLKLKMILGIKAIKGILYAEILLKKIQMVKNLILYDIEKGNEILIPKELGQSSLPYSFRYYDPIIAII